MIEPWRQRVIDSALLWLRTPHRHNTRVMGAGVDCGHHIIDSFVGAGLVPDVQTGVYAADWMLHNTEERYLGFVEQHLDRVAVPLPGDVAVWKFGLCFSHGAIVIAWPQIVHSYRPERGVVLGDATKGLLAREHIEGGGSRPREVRYYSIAGRL